MDEQIAQFVSITGADSGKAKFYVESAGGDVETALMTFYEGEGGDQEGAAGEDDEEMEGEGEAVRDTPTAAQSTGPRTLSGDPAPVASNDWTNQGAATSSSTNKPGAGFSASGGRGGIATLRDMQPESGSSGKNKDSDEDDSKDPANFFAGGERSGLNVQNPNHGKDSKAPEVVEDILKEAAQAGSRSSIPGRSSAREAPASASAPSFGGRGRTINDAAQEETAEQQQPSNLTPRMTSEGMRALRNAPLGRPIARNDDDEDDDDEDDNGDDVAVRDITFWQDGFSIANGPLCRYDDPQHAQTLALIKSGRAPLHLLNVRFDQRVELRVQKKTDEKYKEPPPEPMKPFSGSGNRLGAPVPTMTGAAASSSSSSTTAAPNEHSNATVATSVPEPSSSTLFQVDASRPATQVQIRLGDGQKMVAKFNHTHTVADVRQYINASHPGMTSRPYTLQSSFPPKPLTDETQTLKDAGLINAVVIQKWS